MTRTITPLTQDQLLVGRTANISRRVHSDRQITNRSNDGARYNLVGRLQRQFDFVVGRRRVRGGDVRGVSDRRQRSQLTKGAFDVSDASAHESVPVRRAQATTRLVQYPVGISGHALGATILASDVARVADASGLSVITVRVLGNDARGGLLSGAFLAAGFVVGHASLVEAPSRAGTRLGACLRAFRRFLVVTTQTSTIKFLFQHKNLHMHEQGQNEGSTNGDD